MNLSLFCGIYVIVNVMHFMALSNKNQIVKIIPINT